VKDPAGCPHSGCIHWSLDFNISAPLGCSNGTHNDFAPIVEAPTSAVPSSLQNN